MTEFVAPDLKDPRQNEFVQDYLSAFQAEIPTNQRDRDHIGETVEMVQEIYSPPGPKVPYEVQVKQHRIEQLETLLRVAQDRVRKLEAKLNRSLDVLQEHE